MSKILLCLNKKKQKDLFPVESVKRIKVFWFFFPKKNILTLAF